MKTQKVIAALKSVCHSFFFFIAPHLFKSRTFSRLRLALGAHLSSVFTEKTHILA
ncbi:hypothetical protein HanIR_Chr16g0795051 [Helianthus annuus]|nr:hypothetical protein HanIR_Chr16g0795051 [Helianthus annuus]